MIKLSLPFKYLNPTNDSNVNIENFILRETSYRSNLKLIKNNSKNFDENKNCDIYILTPEFTAFDLAYHMMLENGLTIERKAFDSLIVDVPCIYDRLWHNDNIFFIDSHVCVNTTQN